MRHSHLQHAGTGYNLGHALRYHIYVISEEASSEDEVLFPYGASLLWYRMLFRTDEGEASDDVSKESKQYGSNSSNDIDPNYVYRVQAMC